ncbi:unnamed protein product [Arabis nemorensis]|uniref:Uncharacterized protein n=1 Tax=Arabis nemorensis TaxID=586526 RepID=A0A565C7J5_9BRAS|nr:unnamed protein product [Arabis nemorensis]
MSGNRGKSRKGNTSASSSQLAPRPERIPEPLRNSVDSLITSFDSSQGWKDMGIPNMVPSIGDGFIQCLGNYLTVPETETFMTLQPAGTDLAFLKAASDEKKLEDENTSTSSVGEAKK